MLRFAIPAVLGLCGFGAAGFHSRGHDQDRREPVADRYVDERCVDDRRETRDCRVEYAPRADRYEPRRERSWHVDVDVRRGDRGDRDARFDYRRR